MASVSAFSFSRTRLLIARTVTRPALREEAVFSVISVISVISVLTVVSGDLYFLENSFN